MNGDDFLDFMMSGGDELLNSKVCPYCGGIIYLDQRIEWIDEEEKIAKCPSCCEKVKIKG